MSIRPRTLLVALLALAIAVWMIRFIRDYVRMDACLDRGGAWDPTVQECKGSPQHGV